MTTTAPASAAAIRAGEGRWYRMLWWLTTAPTTCRPRGAAVQVGGAPAAMGSGAVDAFVSVRGEWRAGARRRPYYGTPDPAVDPNAPTIASTL